MNDGSDCRTAPATQGLLKNIQTLNILQTRAKPGAALQTPLSLTVSFSDDLLKYIYGAATP